MADSKVIIDMTVAAEMPAGAVTNLPKVWTGNPSGSSGPLANNTYDGSINAKVYQKLEVAKSDYSTGTSWLMAFTGCEGWTHNNATGWRLPTQRELMMLYIFNTALNSAIERLGGTAFSSTYYWSSTEGSNVNSWVLLISNGTTSTTAKNSTYPVRCVREIIE